MTPNTELSDEQAPANGLPTWEECALRVSNSDFIAKRVAEGGYGPEPDSLLASQLHRFIYEYDDMDPYRSAWFMHRLELLLNEVRAEARAAIPAASLREQPALTPAMIEAGQAALHEGAPLYNGHTVIRVWRAMLAAVPAPSSEGDEGSGGGKGEAWDREDVEAVAACLGDDAAQLRDDNDEDERADNMDRAASMLTWMLMTHPAISPTSPPNGKTADGVGAEASSRHGGRPMTLRECMEAEERPDAGVHGTVAVEDRSHLGFPFDDLPAWRDSAGVKEDGRG